MSTLTPAPAPRRDGNTIALSFAGASKVEPGTTSRSPTAYVTREEDDEHRQKKLTMAACKYQETAKLLEEKLQGFFVKYERQTGNRIWKPSRPLEATEQLPNLSNSMIDIRNALEKLVPAFEVKKNRWWLLKCINKLVELTLPPLKNFLAVGIQGQSVDPLGG
jgi:hypothetical protein